MNTRLEQLTDWLKSVLCNEQFKIEIASADASFRRYFRIFLTDKTLIAMDAPPDKENSEPFVRIATLLSGLGIHVPQIHAKDLNQGFILLEDLGQIDYLDALRCKEKADSLYSDALGALIKIQGGTHTSKTVSVSSIPTYNAAKLREEMSLFKDWYLARHLGLDLTETQHDVWTQTQHFLCSACVQQPQVWVHRDFHSRNLMVTASNNPGVIDFQDLITGPISYDLASLFKDCYIEWPRKYQLEWLYNYYQLLETPSFEFKKLVEWYDLTGFQRHLKVLGIFCRLNYRDGKQRYLADLPLVAKYCLEVLDLYGDKYEVLKAFDREFHALILRAI